MRFYDGYDRIGLEFYYLSFTFIQSIVLALRQYRFSHVYHPAITACK